ncbi:MAG TPA: hypothetical protein VLF91_00270 [Candidatus Saccharimonadales bacterium]|nr:hypothetical protein [Candidatus Saccharimonadales bacterium]
MQIGKLKLKKPAAGGALGAYLLLLTVAALVALTGSASSPMRGVTAASLVVVGMLAWRAFNRHVATLQSEPKAQSESGDRKATIKGKRFSAAWWATAVVFMLTFGYLAVVGSETFGDFASKGGFGPLPALFMLPVSWWMLYLNVLEYAWVVKYDRQRAIDEQMLTITRAVERSVARTARSAAPSPGRTRAPAPAPAERPPSVSSATDYPLREEQGDRRRSGRHSAD